MLVVLGIILNDWLRRMQTKQREEAWKKWHCFQVEHRHGNSAASLKRARVTKSITYIIMRKEKAPIYKSSRSKVSKTQQICHYRYVRKTSGLFLLRDMGAGSSSRNYFANLGSFAKVSVPVGSIIPCSTPWHKLWALIYFTSYWDGNG